MLENNIELYLQSLRIANLSRNTIKTYRKDLKALMTFLGPETDAREIDVNVMRAYVHLLAAKNLSPISRNHALRVFKAFGKFLVDEGILDENVFRLIPQAKVPERLIEPPTVEAVSTLLDGEIPTTWPARDRVELELLYGTGVRVQEAVSIMMPDLLADGTILIHGKGGKERRVPVGSPLKQALDAYLPERETVLRRRKQQSQALFFECKHPSCRHSRWFATLPRKPEPINVGTIRRVLLRVCKAKGLKPMHPHLLRHACATHMLNNGAPLVVIRELLGHAKLSTTAQYAFVSVALMQKTYNAAHPHARS
jgi:site-specific recombinase XerD